MPLSRLLVDKRNAAEVAAQVRDRLPHYVPGWKTREKGPGEALVRIFGRFCEIVIDRLNQAPEKNFLAFLDFLGASPLPPQPARAPLTFYLAQKAKGATVPARTQVAAAPAPGQQEPVIFETEQELQVTATNLDSLLIRDPIRDAYTDGSQILSRPLPVPDQIAVERKPLPAFRGEKPIPHILYVALRLPSPCPVFKKLRLTFGIDESAPASAPGRSVVWEAIQGVLPLPASGAPPSFVPEDERYTVIPLKPSSDATADLTRGGDVVFESFAPVPETEINGVRSRWLRCRFLAPNSKRDLPAAPPGTESRTLKSVNVHYEIERAALRIDRAFANAVPVDLTKEFFPFGVRPKLGDTLYLASREAFSSTNAVVTLHFELLNPASETSQPPILAARPRAAKLIWEFWDGRTWARLGTGKSEPSAQIPDETTNFSDSTEALSDTGDVSFRFPSLPHPGTVNGQTNYWVRVRIAGGDYGAEAHWEQDPDKGFVVVPATIAPPILSAATVNYVLATDSTPEAILSYEDFRYTPVSSQGLKLFQPSDETHPALYLGFTPLPGQSLGSATLTVYFGLAESPAARRLLLPRPIRRRWCGSTGVRTCKGGPHSRSATTRMVSGARPRSPFWRLRIFPSPENSGGNATGSAPSGRIPLAILSLSWQRYSLIRPWQFRRSPLPTRSWVPAMGNPIRPSAPLTPPSSKDRPSRCMSPPCLRPRQRILSRARKARMQFPDCCAPLASAKRFGCAGISSLTFTPPGPKAAITSSIA